MKRKILIVIGSLNLGGTEKQLLNTIGFLKDEFEFRIVTLLTPGDLEKEFINFGVNVVSINSVFKNPLIKNIKRALSIYFEIKKYQPSIVHFYLPHSYLLGAYTSFIFKKIKFIMSRRSMNYYQNKIPFCKTIEKIFHKKMDLIIANSKKNLNQLINEESVKKRKCKLIYNGVEIKKSIKRNKNRIVRLICVANFIEYKNHNMLLKACSLIPKELNWKLVLIGNTNSPLIKDITLLIEKSKLTKKIIIKSKLFKLDRVYLQSDIGILTSNEEGFSNSILEYMSFGLPVIATDVGGNSELIKNNKNGFLVKKNDHVSLSEKITKLIKSHNLRNKFGKEGLNIISNNFGFQLCIEKYRKIYKYI